MRTQAIHYGTRYERAQVFMMDIIEEETTNSDNDVNVYNKVVYTPDLTVEARDLLSWPRAPWDAHRLLFQAKRNIWAKGCELLCHVRRRLLSTCKSLFVW